MHTPSDPLSSVFYDRPVVDVARDLIGCTLLYHGAGGRIVETEAYREDDPASHSHRGKTARNAVMFGPPGRLYVYFTYGMHVCANLVCGPEGEGAAVLVRALEPLHGVEEMRRRRGVADVRALCSGPAKLCRALGIALDENGIQTWAEPLVVLPRLYAGGVADGAASAGASVGPSPVTGPRVVATPRIGVTTADDGRPWRFVDADSTFLSRRLRDRGAST